MAWVKLLGGEDKEAEKRRTDNNTAYIPHSMHAVVRAALRRYTMYI
jgi:hypothetical protein